MNKISAKKNAFTLIEILVVLSITSILFSSLFMVYRSRQTQAQLETGSSEIIQNLRKAQYYTLLGKDNANFGVHFANKKSVLFKNIYTADNLENENFELPPTLEIININLSGSSGITFTSPKGLPDFSGSIVIKAVNGQSRTITINEIGLVQWE